MKTLIRELRAERTRLSADWVRRSREQIEAANRVEKVRVELQEARAEIVAKDQELERARDAGMEKDEELEANRRASEAKEQELKRVRSENGGLKSWFDEFKQLVRGYNESYPDADEEPVDADNEALASDESDE